MYFSAKIKLHLAGFIAVVVPSCRLRTFIRWQHDGITRSSRSRVAIVRPSGSFVIHSCRHRNVKTARWKRWKHECNTMFKDAFPVTLRWWGWWYELNTNHQHRTHLRWFFNMLKNLEPFPKLSPKARKSGRWLKMVKDGTTNSPIWIRSAPILKISIIVLPSA